MPTVVFKSDHKSITQFDEFQLPSFSILTGVNGCGKTHFLQAIQNGTVVVDDITIEEIQYFDPRTFVVGNEGQHSKSQIDQERAQAWKNLNEGWNNMKLKQELVKHKNQLREQKEELIRVSEKLDKPILRLSKDDIVPTNSEAELKTYNAFRQYRREVLKLFKQKQIANDAMAKSVRALALRLKYPIDEITERDFKESYVPLDLKDDFLPTQLSKVFLDYYYREYMELVIRPAEANFYKEEPRIKSPEEFTQIYGPPPWEIVEDILESFSSLNFSINNPKADGLAFRNDEETSFALRIRNPEGQEISFGDLSSGEKVLFALVLSIYKTFSDGYFPRLLLLDEVDASLHPSMTRNLLDVLQETFVERHGVEVFLATHSPSTVALAPQNTIHVVKKGRARDKVQKCSREEALDVLTEGFISLERGLSIADQLARKKVNIFTEGNNEDYLRHLFEMLVPELLPFIEVVNGLKDRSGISQLLPLYEMFLRLDHENHVLFVFDCDYKGQLDTNDTTSFFTIPLNLQNSKIENGIENAFPERLILDEHYDERTDHRKNGEVVRIAKPNKPKICAHIVANATKDDFVQFTQLIEQVRALCA